MYARSVADRQGRVKTNCPELGLSEDVDMSLTRVRLGMVTLTLCNHYTTLNEILLNKTDSSLILYHRLSSLALFTRAPH